MWMGGEGMMMCGTNGSQLWDIGFITQALVETGLAYEEENKESLLKALERLDEAQIQNNPKHHHTSYRHATKGAWVEQGNEQCDDMPWFGNGSGVAMTKHDHQIN